MKKAYFIDVKTHLLKAGVVLFSLVFQANSAIADCTINSVGVLFSSYSALDSFPNNSGIGTVTVSCRGADASPMVSLTTGQHSSSVQRSMRSPTTPDKLKYNIFTDSARTIVWGDGRGQGSVVGIQASGVTILSLYGQIDPGQDAATGDYSDILTVTVNF